MVFKLDWDSSFFGLNIASVENAEELDKEFLNYIHINKIAFVQALCRIDEIHKISILECFEFHFADVKMTYNINLLNNDKYVYPWSFELATMEDKQKICKIAENSFDDSRYYGYEHIFKTVRVNEMYRLWAEKSIVGQFDDFCLKIVKQGEIAGFITVKLKDSTTAVIGIFAVSKEFRNKGVGGELMQSLLCFLKEKNIEEVEVSTQGKNISAQNFYIKHGFKVQKIESWYYRYSGKSDI